MHIIIRVRHYVSYLSMMIALQVIPSQLPSLSVKAIYSVQIDVFAYTTITIGI